MASSERREVQRGYSTLWCAVRQKRGEYVIHVYGELDLATVADFDAALREAEASKAKKIIVDLAEVSAIDSTGLRSLVLFNERCEAAGRAFVIRRGSRRTHRVFEATQLDDRLPFEEEDLS